VDGGIFFASGIPFEYPLVTGGTGEMLLKPAVKGQSQPIYLCFFVKSLMPA